MSGATCAIFMMTFDFSLSSIEKALGLPGSWGAGNWSLSGYRRDAYQDSAILPI